VTGDGEEDRTVGAVVDADLERRAAAEPDTPGDHGRDRGGRRQDDSRRGSPH
jgi:hypothetical protein